MHQQHADSAGTDPDPTKACRVSDWEPLAPAARVSAQALERLALQEPDPRPRRAAAWALADAGAALRGASALPGAGGAGAGGARALQALPADGAMRALVEALLEPSGAAGGPRLSLRVCCSPYAIARTGAPGQSACAVLPCTHVLLVSAPPTLPLPKTPPGGRGAQCAGRQA